MKAHQRRIREAEAERNPRSVIPLDRCRVERVDVAWAERIILRYEWLGTMPATGPVACYGLLGAKGEPLGAAVFGLGPGSNARNVCGPKWYDRTVVLERGACVHYAHEHAGSFLTARSVKLLGQETDYRVVIAYADAEAGEVGTIYQACNWLYLGSGNGRSAGFRASRWYGRRIGDDKWMNSRTLRALARRELSVVDPPLLADGRIDTSFWWMLARESGEWEFRKIYDRARYVTFTGSRQEQKQARKALLYSVHDYPKRRATIDKKTPAD